VVNMRLSPYLPPVAVTITFSGSAMPASVTVRRVDEAHANALPLYTAIGAPQYPNSTAITALKQASELVKESLIPTPGKDGAWSLSLNMPIYSVASISF